ncbi:transcription factor BHLH148 [Elaeis guineensis]|uniref:Transcription factor BHLH148 isoform X2 n=1 Tax=Elaeis guineensis var. tenera TaxID=51953 RepID=A0A6I9RC68_ELAGV|nr:transcription factor BHLH148 isoform X2 [Elaeis guineensis]
MDPFPFRLQGDDEYQEYLNLAFSPPLSFDLLPAISNPQLPPQSAFVDYTTFNGETSSQSSGCRQQQTGGRNIHRRVIGFLRTIPMATRQESFRDVPEASKEFRHLMRERERRERLSQGYADLRHMLCTRSKGDKNSVIQAAAAYLQELKGARDVLRKCNEELEEMVAVNRRMVEGATIKLRVMNPSSTIDSLIGALQRIREMELEVASIEANLCSQELSAVVNLKSKNVAIAEVEGAMECALREAEKSSHHLSSQQCNFSLSCHVENAP